MDGGRVALIVCPIQNDYVRHVPGRRASYINRQREYTSGSQPKIASIKKRKYEKDIFVSNNGCLHVGYNLHHYEWL